MQIEVNVPDGRSGPWAVETMVLTEADVAISNIRAAFKPGCRTCSPGTYKRLRRDGETIMSNTPAEISDHMSFIWRCERVGGNILINGLGLGVALSKILEFENINSVTVVEKSEDVISLVGPSFANDQRVEIIHADAFEWKPPRGKRYTAVWHDIWDNICADNLPEMTKLHRKHGRRCDWQGSWAKDLCRRYV
jgi:hypothetical protein